ncbi:MAG TPA: hypothetical protein VHE14_05205, partial [Solirubrobacteraceae bacterium]|nr:hypothetical protein [Solirubrobacteraceae bacterium]
MGAITLTALVLAARRWRQREPGFAGAGIALALAIGTIGLPLALALVGIDDMVTRNVAIAWVPLGLVAAYGLAGGRLGGALTTIWCALCAWLVVVGGAQQSVRRPDWHLAASLLGPARQARVIGAADGYRALPLQLYVPGSRGLPYRGATVSELDLIAVRHGYRRTCWWGAQCNLSPGILSSRPPLPGFKLAGTSARGQFELLRFVAVIPQRVKRRALQVNRVPGQRLALLLQAGR